jgi:hypothetical protein
MKPAVCALLCTLHAVSAYAWRPLGSEEAQANVRGRAHVETVWSRDVDGTRYLTVIPSYTPLPGLDLLAITNRNLTDGSLEQALQAKIQWSSVRYQDCFLSWVGGVTLWQKGEGQKSFLSANGSCDLAMGTLYSSLMTTRDAHGRAVPSLSLAWEQSYGPWTGFLETVSESAQKPLSSLGVRRDVLPGLQLEGIWGKQGRQAVISLGTRFTF